MSGIRDGLLWEGALGLTRRVFRAKQPVKRLLLESQTQSFNKYLQISSVNDKPDTGPKSVLWALRETFVWFWIEASFYVGETKAVTSTARRPIIIPSPPHPQNASLDLGFDFVKLAPTWAS